MELSEDFGSSPTVNFAAPPRLCFNRLVCCSARHSISRSHRNSSLRSPATFSSSRNDAGETSECLRSSGDRGMSRTLLALLLLLLLAAFVWPAPSLTSEWRRWRAPGSSRRFSPEAPPSLCRPSAPLADAVRCVWPRPVVRRRQMLHRHLLCKHFQHDFLQVLRGFIER
jgi:hypothetical protein